MMKKPTTRSTARTVLARPVTQAQFGEIVGIQQSAVSELVARGVLEPTASAGEWLAAYCQRLREQAAGRMNDDGSTLVRERARLAKEDADAAAMKNATARGEYAPIGLLADVLGNASAALVAQLDQFDADLAKVWPGMPEAALNALRARVARARNTWVEETCELVDRQLAELDAAADEGEVAP